MLKKLERFLVMFALLSLILQVVTPKAPAMLILIALPALAAFYLFGAVPLCYPELRSEKTWVARLLLTLVTGLGLAYCLCCLAYFELRVVRAADMLVNCCLILGILTTAALIGKIRKKHPCYDNLLIRILPMLVVILLLGFLKK